MLLSHTHTRTHIQTQQIFAHLLLNISQSLPKSDFLVACFLLRCSWNIIKMLSTVTLSEIINYNGQLNGMTTWMQTKDMLEREKKLDSRRFLLDIVCRSLVFYDFLIWLKRCINCMCILEQLCKRMISLVSKWQIISHTHERFHSNTNYKWMWKSALDTEQVFWTFFNRATRKLLIHVCFVRVLSFTFTLKFQCQ